ncbi:MAG: type I-U CRISPR-associated protein Cas7 [Candidatus Schekmanbacteria bacterium]|nr:type I-U CRISPR-associated protein Cas7 [Candidatus Schekmanbacteria bacterium]
MFERLVNERRILMEAELAPVQGHRFQPTGFADIGAATYQLADGTRMLLVESAQSMANRLEATVLGPDNELLPELAGLSYVRVQLEGAVEATTSSLSEAHRLNSPFIIGDEDFRKKLLARAGYEKGRPVDWRKVGTALFFYDVNALVHGVFLANAEDGRVKVPRALSGFIEATAVREAVSGGVKNNPIDPSGKLRTKQLDKDVYGNVPFHRTEYTAERTTAYFNLDLELLRSYQLGEDAWRLLVALALFKVRRFLDRGMRLRTACDLRVVGELQVTEPTPFSVPTSGVLLEQLRADIIRCRPLFADPAVTELRTRVDWKKDQKKERDEEESED